MKTILRINYPSALVSQPVVSKMIETFHVEVNILRAQVSREEGWLIVEIRGELPQILDAMKWLKNQGLEITENPALDSSD